MRRRKHISRGYARRVRGLSCDREASRNFNRPGGSNPVENRSPGRLQVAGVSLCAPDQFEVELTPSACGAAVFKLGSGAEPRACGLADGLGLGERLISCALPARIRLAHRAARPTGPPKLGRAWRRSSSAPGHGEGGGAVSMHTERTRYTAHDGLQARTSCSS